MQSIPMPGRTFMALAIVVLFALDGLWRGFQLLQPDDWYVEAAYLAGFVVGAAAKGALLGGLLWLCAKGAEGFRLKNPAPWLKKAALGIYLLGLAIGAYILIVAIYTLSVSIHALSANEPTIPLILSLSALLACFAGRAISYALGR